MFFMEAGPTHISCFFWEFAHGDVFKVKGTYFPGLERHAARPLTKPVVSAMVTSAFFTVRCDHLRCALRTLLGFVLLLIINMPSISEMQGLVAVFRMI